MVDSLLRERRKMGSAEGAGDDNDQFHTFPTSRSTYTFQQPKGRRNSSEEININEEEEKGVFVLRSVLVLERK
jgi:hypothetical protein